MRVLTRIVSQYRPGRNAEEEPPSCCRRHFSYCPARGPRGVVFIVVVGAVVVAVDCAVAHLFGNNRNETNQSNKRVKLRPRRSSAAGSPRDAIAGARATDRERAREAFLCVMLDVTSQSSPSCARIVQPVVITATAAAVSTSIYLCVCLRTTIHIAPRSDWVNLPG